MSLAIDNWWGPDGGQYLQGGLLLSPWWVMFVQFNVGGCIDRWAHGGRVY